MDNQVLLHLDPEPMSVIFSYLIVELDDFTSFARLLMVWERNKPTHVVRDVLERLNWNDLYEFHQHAMEVRRDQFYGFVGYCVRHNVTQALFFNSTTCLFLQQGVDEHISVLSNLAGNHFPSSFSFLFFKAIYRPFELAETAEQMFVFVKQSRLMSSIKHLMSLMQDIYFRLFEYDYLLPVYKFCPNARNLDPIYQIDGPPFMDELWHSLCSDAVEDTSVDESWPYVKTLRLEHIWNSECRFCTLQLILFKILLGSVHD